MERKFTEYVSERIRVKRVSGERIIVQCGIDCYKVAKIIYKDLDDGREHFTVVALDNRRAVIGWKVISTGTASSSLVHPREIFRYLIPAGAISFLLIHNHPSGDVTPSPEDIEVTKRLSHVGELVGIRLEDHCIVDDEQTVYMTFMERSIMPFYG